MASYVIPIFGETIDIAIAPISAAWIYFAYDNKVMSAVGFIEEILPFTDIIPSCTIAHILSQKKKD
jgi:hypothetical protein